jgi:hypothetical protein
MSAQKPLTATRQGTSTSSSSSAAAALSFPPVAPGQAAVPPGRFENPGRQGGTGFAVLAFGPDPGVSALTRNYTSSGALEPAPEQAVSLYANPVRGLNYLA